MTEKKSKVPKESIDLILKQNPGYSCPALTTGRVDSHTVVRALEQWLRNVYSRVPLQTLKLQQGPQAKNSVVSEQWTPVNSHN